MRRAKGEGSLIKRSGCRFWYASFYDATGKQVRISTKTEVKQEALAELRRLMGKAEAGQPVGNGRLKYGDLRRLLLDNYMAKGNKTLETRADGSETIVGLPQLDSYCGYEPECNGQPLNMGLPVSKLTSAMADDFARKRKAEDPPAGAAMINRSLQCLRRMLHIAHERNLIAVVPKIQLHKEPGARKGFLEPAKFAELLGALPGYVRPLIAFLYWSGCRKGEALQIDWSQVDLDARTITLHDEQTKNREGRVVPLHSEVIAMLRGTEPKTGQVFDGTNLRTEWETACASVGLGKREKITGPAGYSWHKYEGLIVHDLRRSAVRNLRRAGVSETVAMRISGHKTAAVFRRYNITSTDDVLAAMRAVEVAQAKALPGAIVVRKPARRASAKLVQKFKPTRSKPA